MPRVRPSYEVVQTALRKQFEVLLCNAVESSEPIPREDIEALGPAIVGVFLQEHFAFHTLEAVREVAQVSFQKSLDWFARWQADQDPEED